MPKSLRSHAASLAVAACIVILGGAVDHAGASEFIYGHTSWTAVSGNTVQFTVRGAFRRSGMPCIDLTTNSQTDSGGRAMDIERSIRMASVAHLTVPTRR